jgi:hypothetical protein
MVAAADNTYRSYKRWVKWNTTKGVGEVELFNERMLSSLLKGFVYVEF